MITAKSQKTSKPAVKRKANRSRTAVTARPKQELGKEPLSGEEATKILNTLESTEERTLLLLGFNTGLRATEIASIEPINFEFNSGILRIWDKRKHLYRSVYLSDEVISEIRAFIDTKKESSGPRLFPYTARSIDAKFQKLTLRILGKSRSWESVRRTYIYTSAKLDIPIGIVVENTGEAASSIVKHYMEVPLVNARRMVNEAQLYPDSPRLMLKSDELKKILEKPYVEKIERIVSERNRLRGNPA